MCSKAPDMTAQNIIAGKQAALSQEQMDWMKQLYAETAPDRKAATERANLIGDKQLESLDQQNKLTKDYADYQENTFRPLEKKIVADSQTYDSPEKQEAEAGKAAAGVTQAFTNTRAQTGRNMARMGINPASGAAVAGQQSLDVQQALGTASAENVARQGVITQGYARKMDAANLGRNLASNQATSAGIALSQGNSSVANAQVGGNIASQGAQMMNSGYSGAQSGFANSAKTYNDISTTQQRTDMANASNMTSMAQSGMAMSDKNLKEKVKAIDPEKALESVVNTPISEWQFKEGNIASDGAKRHIGGMAQDIKKTMGDDVAPNGKKIDLVSMNGINMAAIQAVSKKVDKLMASNGTGRSAA
jgi:hypothetical protein